MSILMQASQEYAKEGDPLYNFTTIARLIDRPAREVLITDLMKHIVSICQGVSLREPMRGRIIDAMNYLRLLAYMESQETNATYNQESLHSLSNGSVSAVPNTLEACTEMETETWRKYAEERRSSGDWVSHSPGLGGPLQVPTDTRSYTAEKPIGDSSSVSQSELQRRLLEIAEGNVSACAAGY